MPETPKLSPTYIHKSVAIDPNQPTTQTNPNNTHHPQHFPLQKPQVTIFEASDVVGGRLHARRVPILEDGTTFQVCFCFVFCAFVFLFFGGGGGYLVKGGGVRELR